MADVGSEPVRQLHHPRDGVLLAVVDRDVRAELHRLLEPRRVEVDRDNAARRMELRGHDRRQPDRAGPDDRDRVARFDASVEHADLGRGREDVGEEQHLLVRELVRHLVDGGVGERDAGELGLQPVDQVTEDPASAAGAEPVAAFLAEPAPAARRDAGDEHAVSRLQRRDGAAGLHNSPHGLVAEDRARQHLRHVSLEDVEVGATDRRRVNPHDRIGRVLDCRVGHILPGPLPRPVVHERFHLAPPFSPSLAARRGDGIGGGAESACGLFGTAGRG
jgi:hypothetical protein